jgi:hypothetical protein
VAEVHGGLLVPGRGTGSSRPVESVPPETGAGGLKGKYEAGRARGIRASVHSGGGGGALDGEFRAYCKAMKLDHS